MVASCGVISCFAGTSARPTGTAKIGRPVRECLEAGWRSRGGWAEVRVHAPRPLLDVPRATGIEVAHRPRRRTRRPDRRGLPPVSSGDRTPLPATSVAHHEAVYAAPMHRAAK